MNVSMENHLPLTFPQARLLALIDGYVGGVDAVVRAVFKHGLTAERPEGAVERVLPPRRGELPKPFKGRFRIRGRNCVILISADGGNSRSARATGMTASVHTSWNVTFA